MNMMNNKMAYLATTLILLSAGLSGCCCSGGCGLKGGGGCAHEEVVVPQACTTCQSPVVVDQFHAGVSNVPTEIAQPATTYVAENIQYAPSSYSSGSVGSSTKSSCGST